MGGNASKMAKEKYEEVNNDMQAALFSRKMQQLDSWKFLTIEQQIYWSQAFKCCEKNNSFSFHVSKDNGHLMPLGNVGLTTNGTFEEKSDWCCRLFIRAAREFKGQLRIDGDVITNLDVPYKCHSAIPCCSCPCSEPIALISNANHSKIIGQLLQPYYVCWCKSVEPCPLIEIQVMEVGEDGRPQYPPVYIISGNCLQSSSACLPFMCLGCPIISYGIFDGKKPDHKDKPLGLIKNFCRDCPEECFTKADRFGIDFPEEATAKQKLLLINAAIWLNYLQYEFS